jgi:hypothetical protein
MRDVRGKSVLYLVELSCCGHGGRQMAERSVEGFVQLASSHSLQQATISVYNLTSHNLSLLSLVPIPLAFVTPFNRVRHTAEPASRYVVVALRSLSLSLSLARLLPALVILWQ